MHIDTNYQASETRCHSIGLCSIGLGIGTRCIWGIVRQVEVVQLRQQTQITIGTVKIVTNKTEVLDKKIQNLNQISEENKQMLKGAESGTPAQGGGW